MTGLFVMFAKTATATLRSDIKVELKKTLMVMR
jgi:hypothetical protein